MSKLKLPTPLPYDFVDQMLDEQYNFYQYEDEEQGLTMFSCTRKRETGLPRTSNWCRQFMQVIPEPKENESGEGYLDDPYIPESAWCWTAEEMTEEEIDTALITSMI